MKANTYDHGAIEAHWQAEWDRVRLNETDIQNAKKPFYNLMMFPYPSAEGLHVGNMYAFTGSDVYGRFKRMQGYDVFEPIGLDGFGIHSENFALKIGRHPMDHAEITEKNYYAQLHKIGAMFDWTRTVETYDPGYYRWTQWLFTQMFKHGLAHRAKAQVNWCPSCKTVLADEQVIDGKCERCGNNVEKRLLEQWFFRITAYAEKLLENSFSLDWSEKVRVAQKNWIGKKEGIEITYTVVDENGKNVGEIACFTTRPDTNFGATFVVLAPEHPFVASILDASTQAGSVTKSKQREEIRKYVEASAKKTQDERAGEDKKKTGVATQLFCINQLNDTKMPLWVSDFVLMGFGTGAVVGVPGHDMRDYEFAMQFDIPIKRVVVGPDGDRKPITKREQVQEDEGKMINSGFLDGMDIQKAIGAMMDHLAKQGWGKRVSTYHLRDWLISRQRYWGPPIPMIYCEKCAKEGRSWFTTEEAKSLNNESGIMNNGKEKNEMAGWYPVPDDQLPVVLPRIDDYKPGNDGVAPLAKHKEFYETTCPGCSGHAVRETDVSDTFLDSSWYFLRYPSVGSDGKVDGAKKFQSPNNESGIMNHGKKQTHSESAHNSSFIIHDSRGKNAGKASAFNGLPWDPDVTRAWLPVHMYTGGAEHSVLHLMYSRFVTMALKDWGYLDFDEPFGSFYAHGLVIKDGAKMSKSKGNVVNPDEYIKLYGADALRLYLMFMGPFDQGGDFRDTAMEGMSRWTGRVWRLAQEVLAKQSASSSATIRSALHKAIKKVTDDLSKRRYNTAIATMMEFTNLVADEGGASAISSDDLKTFVLMLAPFAPYVSEELYQKLAQTPSDAFKKELSVHLREWPAARESAMIESDITVVVQVNGKLRDSVSVTRQVSGVKEDIERIARGLENVKRHLEGKTVRKVIFVPGKLMNFVV